LRGSTRRLACTPGQKWPRCVASSLLLWLAILIAGTRHPAVESIPGQHPHNHISFVTPSVHQSSLCSPFFPLVVWTNHADLSHSPCRHWPPPAPHRDVDQAPLKARGTSAFSCTHTCLSARSGFRSLGTACIHACMGVDAFIFRVSGDCVCCLVFFCRVVAFHPSQPYSSPTHIASYGL
jgi:hypothetical protein